MPKVIYHDSDGVDKTVQLGTEPVLIGRASDCEIQTHDAMVSRKHARIIWDGSYWVEDLGSSNGVFLGSDKVQRAPFRPGDVVTCGSLVLRMLPETRRPQSSEPDLSPARKVPTRAPDSALDSPRGLRAEPRGGAQVEQEWDESVRTSASPALAGGGVELQKAKAELRREVERRENAEAALLSCEEKLAQSEAAAREVVQLRRRVEQLQSDLRRARDDAPAPAPSPALDVDEIAEAALVFNDALAELKASLRAAVDEADLLTAPSASVRVVRESMRSAMDELERARLRLREMTGKLGLRGA